jgi:hypothetical protein
MDIKNIDNLLQNALKSSEKPDAELVKKVKYNLSKKEEENLKKPTAKRTFGRVAAILIASLIITSTVFAAGIYLGSFDRLRQTIGGEQAELLYPLEITNLPEPIAPEERISDPVTDSTIIDLNEEEEDIFQDNIRVELVAISVIDHVVDIYVTLEDLAGNRLDGDFAAGHIVHPTGEEGQRIGGVSGSCQIISRDNGVVTLRSRQFFTHSVAGMELMYALDGISYNRRRYSNRDIDIDFGTVSLSPQPHLQFVSDFDSISLGWVGGDDSRFRRLGVNEHGDTIGESYIAGSLGEQIQNTGGLPVLQPHLHDIEMGISGVNTTISSIGIIDNRLHIQSYNHAPRNYVGLRDPYGNQVNANLIFLFDIDSNGQPIPAPRQLYPNDYGCGLYFEKIFEIDLGRLSEYSLGITFSTSDRIQFRWHTYFEVERNEVQFTVDGLNVQLQRDEAVVTEIRVTPSLIHVMAECIGDGFETGSVGVVWPIEVVVHTANRAVQTIQNGGINSPNGTGTFIQNFFFDVIGNPLDLDDIISIEVDGERVEIAAVRS